MRTEQYSLLRTHTKTSLWCCGPTQKPDLPDVVYCGRHANDSHTGVPWMLLNHTKILCSLGVEKVAGHAALSALLRRHKHKTLAHKKSPAQSHVLGEQRKRHDLQCFVPQGTQDLGVVQPVEPTHLVVKWSAVRNQSEIETSLEMRGMSPFPFVKLVQQRRTQNHAKPAHMVR